MAISDHKGGNNVLDVQKVNLSSFSLGIQLRFNSMYGSRRFGIVEGDVKIGD